MDLLIKAFNKVFKGKDIILKIGGDGYFRQSLENLTTELAVQDQIVFLGALDRLQVVKQMNSCDGFVLASEHETFGAVYTEALAVGKPILGTKNGGAEDIIKDYNGIIVENKNVDKLAEGLIRFVEELPNFKSEEIISKCYLEYSEETIINKIKKIYTKVKGEN